jgi:hypothetical protein
MASIFFTPFILFFCLLKCVDDVLRFVQDFTVHIEGVGHVCSLSVFDFEHHGNSKYGSPYQTSKDRHSSQGKMEKSFLRYINILIWLFEYTWLFCHIISFSIAFSKNVRVQILVRASLVGYKASSVYGLLGSHGFGQVWQKYLLLIVGRMWHGQLQGQLSSLGTRRQRQTVHVSVG